MRKVEAKYQAQKHEHDKEAEVQKLQKQGSKAKAMRNPQRQTKIEEAAAEATLAATEQNVKVLYEQH